jgi:DNA polymerase-3 subunit beta
MKINILKENLKQGLDVVERVAGKNLTLPILNNILISTEKNLLKLSSTDLELGIKYWTLAKIEKEGEITVPAKVFSSYINFLPEKKLILEVKGQTMHIDCENQKTQIKGLGAEEYPIIPKIESEDFIEINIQPFIEGLSQVVNFTSLNQARPELSGLYMSFQKDGLRLVSTDSFRLAEKTLYFEKKISKEYSFILPQKTARELINIFADKKGKIKLYYSPNQVLFEYAMPETDHPQIQIISRLIEGDYPDYQEIIPKKYDAQAVLTRTDFLNQIKAASIFSGKSNEIKIKLEPGKQGIEILSENPECGENKSFLSGKIEGNETKKIEVVFNYRFLIDGLADMKGAKITLGLNGEEGPASLKQEGDPNYLYIVMPIKSV